MLKIAIIGGAGFIGTRLCRRLKDCSNEYEIIIVDKAASASFPELTVLCDIREKSSLRSALKGVDVVVNLAAEHRDDVSPVSLYHDVNVVGQKNICEIMTELAITRHIFTSSVAVYGFVDKDTDEDGAYAPFHPYGQSKLDAEYVLNDWHDSGKQHSVLRPTVVFGEGNRGNVYNLLAQIASGKFLMIGSGTNKKSMAYVENIAAFLEYLILNGSEHQVFNYVDKPDFDMNTLYGTVCDALGKKPSVLRMPFFVGLIIGYCFDVLAKVLGKKLPISSLRVRKFCARTQFSSSRIAATGFKPPVLLADALKKTVVSEFGR